MLVWAWCTVSTPDKCLCWNVQLLCWCDRRTLRLVSVLVLMLYVCVLKVNSLLYFIRSVVNVLVYGTDVLLSLIVDFKLYSLYQ